MSKKLSYVPPFTITDEITTLVAEISEMIGELSVTTENLPSPKLRKQNRIKTIQSSLAIENNTLSIEQVTDILDGKRVLGAPNEIKEVKNAIDAYNLLLELNPYNEKDLLRAHKLMLSDLVRENGKYQFFGGRAEEVEKRTKVKARVVAHALEKLIKEAAEFYFLYFRFRQSTV